jgi:hypothetical protein
MAKNLVYIGIAGLVVIAVILGYNIYQQQGGTLAPINNSVNPLSQSNNQQPQTTQAATIPDADWAKIENFDDSKVNQAEGEEFTNLVIKYGVDTNSIEIKQCEASPLVANIKMGSNFTIKNTDTLNQVMNFFSKEYVIKPGETVTILSQFTPGIFRYACSLNNATYYPVAGVIRSVN